MIYADYSFYTDVFGGTAISEKDFARYAAEGSAFIDRATFGRAAEHADDERLKMCCCAVAENVCSAAATGGMVKQSESVGSWSYTLNSAAADKTVSSLMYDSCRHFLPAEWLYKGVARE